MHDIDFLPTDYVCVQTTRKNDTWLRSLFVTVLVVMAAGRFEHQRSLQDLMAHRDRAQAHAAKVLSQIDSGAQLRSQLKHGEDQSRLLHGLRSHVSPTRWLTAVVGALPERTVLTEIHSEPEDNTHIVGFDVSADSNSAQNASLHPIHQDLQRFVKQAPRRAILISLRGAAADDLEVSELLQRLNQSALFERVQLLYTDQRPRGDVMQRSFAIRLRTRSPLTTQRTNQPVASDDRGSLQH